MKPINIRDARRDVGLWLGGAAALVILGYALFVALPYLEGPALTLEARSAGGLTTVFGETSRVSFLSINGAEIPLEEGGSYSVVRAYPAGYTAVTAVARDRFGRSITKTITFVAEEATTTYGGKKEN